MRRYAGWRIALVFMVCAIFQPVFAENLVATPAETDIPNPPQPTDYEIPSWFKQSFLDLAEDVKEATAANKHVLLFFHLDNCPYCAKMLKDNFEAEPQKNFIQKNFDVIDLNVLGSREVMFSQDISLSEKELATKLDIKYTPTVLFLDSDNKVITRLNGYQAASDFIRIMDFVQTKAYQKSNLDEYLKANPVKTN